MFKKLIVLLCSVFVLSALVACGGSGSSDSGDSADSGSSSAPATAESRSTAAAVQSAGLVSSMTDISDIFSGGPASLSRLATKGLSDKDEKLKPVLSALQAMANQGAFDEQSQSRVVAASGSCPDGGTYSTSGGIVTYTDCRSDDVQMNGTVTTSGTDITVNMSVSNYSNGALTTVVEFSNFSAVLSGVSPTITMTYSGNVTVRNMATGDSHSLTYSSFAMEIAVTSSLISTVTNGTINTISVEDGDTYTGSIVFDAFTMLLNTSTLFMEIDGTITIDFTPDHCGEGEFVYNTVTAMQMSAVTGDIIAGELHITIDSGTPIVIVYNSDGTVTVNGGYSYSIYELENSCAMINLNPETPTTSGDTGTASAADQFTFTLTWDGATSDIDSHLTYYTTTSPTSSDLHDAHLYYASGVAAGSDCSSPDCSDSVAIGNTFAKLDIDDTDGYGPEHITMASMPDGYYVISAYEFSMHNDLTTTATYTVQIGSELFTFDPHTYDADDSVSDMVRICDISVSGGIATILTPDVTISARTGSRVKEIK